MTADTRRDSRKGEVNPYLLLCRASGEGTQDFRLVRDEAGVFAFYEEMCGRDQDKSLDSIVKTFRDPDYWSHEGQAFSLELYCAQFEVWKVLPDEVSLAGSESATLLHAAEAVCWFDWSGNDPDAVACIERLRNALIPRSMVTAPDPICKHPHILRGYARKHDTAWCDDCGKLTWASDGLIPANATEKDDYGDWCRTRVIAWGCKAEADRGAKCARPCGHCPMSITPRDGRD